MVEPTKYVDNISYWIHSMTLNGWKVQFIYIELTPKHFVHFKSRLLECLSFGYQYIVESPHSIIFRHSVRIMHPFSIYYEFVQILAWPYSYILLEPFTTIYLIFHPLQLNVAFPSIPTAFHKHLVPFIELDGTLDTQIAIIPISNIKQLNVVVYFLSYLMFTKQLHFAEIIYLVNLDILISLVVGFYHFGIHHHRVLLILVVLLDHIIRW